MNFFKTIRDSIYSPQFYAQLPKKSLGSAFGYFFLLLLIVVLLQSILPIWSLVTVGQKEVEKVFTNVVQSYPSDLEVKIENGTVVTNVSEPYFIPLPSDFKTDVDDKNLLVIDTKTPFSTTQMTQYQTPIWVTKDAVFIKNGNEQLRTIDLSKTTDTTINKDTITMITNKIEPWLKLLTPLGIIFIFVGLYIVYTFRLLYVFFLALLIMLVAKIMKKSISYGESYKVGLYAMTAGFFVEIIAGWFNFPGFPFMFTIITLGVVMLNGFPTPKPARKK